MLANPQFILDTFTRYNELCFGGTLPPIPIKLTKARTFLGKLTYVARRNFFGKVIRYENFCLRISTLFDLPERELEDVVIHEMIHYYIAMNRIKDTSTHGKVFKAMMRQINAEFGRDIKVRSKRESFASEQLS